MQEYNWTPASGADVVDIVAMAQQHFETEIDEIFTPDPVALSRNMTFAIVNQFYLPSAELVSIARDSTGRLLAYTWAKNGDRAPWSDDVMINVRMAHVALDLSARHRVRLITEMLDIWERWAHYCGTRIVCSTTMRKDQTAFLRLHQRHGYDVRGSYAYKRWNTTQATPANSLSPD